MNSLKASFEQMGSHFLVAGFVPALGFVTLAMFAFNPIMPEAVSRRLGGTFNPLGQTGLIMLILTVILGYMLVVLNNFLIKVCEGYILLEHFPGLRKRELKKERILKAKINRLGKALNCYRQKDKMDHPKAQKLLSAIDSLQIRHQQLYPAVRSEIMPTAFGNILKAAEYYSMENYYIDSVIYWPRLINVISPAYGNKIQDSRNQLSFVVNCGFLAVLFSVCSLMASVYQCLLCSLSAQGRAAPFYFIEISLEQTIYEQRALIYACIGIMAILFAGIFFRASMVSVSEFGGMIRSAYDLFRFDLLESLHMELPVDSWDERDMWKNIGNIASRGYRWEEEPDPLTYKHPSPVQKN